MKWYLFGVYLFSSLNLFAADYYSEKIQPIFNNRCIACHSCYDSPCQLNLQSYDGLMRGANKANVYNGTRLNSVQPTRMEIDAKTKEEWRKLKFFDVVHSDMEKNIMNNILRTKPLELRDLPSKTVEESSTCIDDSKILRAIFTLTEDLKMPYGLQPLEEVQMQTLTNWLKLGATGPLEQKKNRNPEVLEWESFLNGKELKQKLVSRYIYEHLFLAHIYFENNQNDFYRLVRSKSECEKNIDEIATRRPNDYPGSEKFFYCLKPVKSTIVAKTHMPFKFSPKVLKETKDLFFGYDWKITSIKNFKDSYSNSVAENPFLAFKDIPSEMRYRFLLNHAHYMVSTFIKGPVCNGSIALNSIQDQFYVFFIKPESSFMVAKNHEKDFLNELLIMPGNWGSDVKVLDTLKLSNLLVEKREEYRREKAEWFAKSFPEGYSYKDIWDGDGYNDNALLTVFRHDDNALVVKGAKGDLSKTYFVLDYSLFERLVYNLVVNFDVFGNVGHQLLTRMYMDYIRMEAEENYLLFMPQVMRLPLRQEWYKGMFTNLKMKYQFPLITKDHPVNIKYKKNENAPVEFFEHLFYDYFKPSVRGNPDYLNWKTLRVDSKESEDAIEQTIKNITSTKTIKSKRFPSFFPESSLLMVELKNGEKKVYTILKNRDHENISWILGESLRLNPEGDTLSVLAGYAAFYPNFFFKVKEQDLKTFTMDVLSLVNPSDFKELKLKYGVSRIAKDFWTTYDILNQNFKDTDSLNFGYLDLSRYLME